MESLLDGYPTSPLIHDELLGSDGVRPQCARLARGFDRLGAEEVRSRAAYLASRYVDSGVTFDLGGTEKPFPLDIMPRIIEAREWDTISTGVAQRVYTLERFLGDVYGSGQVFDDGVVPRRLVVSSPNFVREVAGIAPANGVRIHVAGIDLIRDGDGTMRVLEDNVRIPSGVSYVLTNRAAMAGVLPDIMRRHNVEPVDVYPSRLRAALEAAAPAGVSEPNVVVLTPGVYNSAYYEHSLLARTMGVPLVEGPDLVCRQGRVYVRTTSGLNRVDVIYRRVDDDFIDPVHFRPDSVLGAAGLVSAVANGTVTVANWIGNGVADDKLIYTYLPDLIRYYCGEEPVLPNVDTWRLDEPDSLAEVLDRLDELVVKPVDGSGGKGIIMGPECTGAQIDAARARLRADPRGWIAQPLVQLSTVPTFIDDRLVPRRVDLRPFAVNDGNAIWVLPGGLTRVALGEGQFIVNSSQGGGSKDTWVLGAPGTRRTEPLPSIQIQAAAPTRQAEPRLAASGPMEQPDRSIWEAQQGQQQQAGPPGRDVEAGEETAC
ncbi:circularly permuted type 2 ATP-grasp protein [Acidipropionibacterium acidipropionici]|uniref:Circularly permuted ATP-grasp type 2 domain-containing protein n=1 Tax=Acidipropionibacterium acidipropionici TaxID=1748 RepID=A0AAC9FC24_9ACTN|nr:circularly permuted type 2 ATP-grasp protein [Acidipropionibacterium acidipropionici]AMS04824.1 hypothetical protein AXH35_04335 [Acidipropionibacterium acidipropionici]AOZ46311.1 hypothetical protein A8L58_05800 [Acidipropionibacterium acidipropionici]AZP37654.1 circularly permuted type 2 ATP-grasp protein [Acidipropionibacterium acidipropionici]